MEFRFLILCLAFLQVASSQYYTVPASSYASCYCSQSPSSVPLTPTYTSITRNLQPRNLLPPPKTLKRNIGSTAKSSVKCSPQTASAYFLTTPSEKVRANVLNKANTKVKSPVPYSCALCNNFADVPPSSKIPPPPGSPVLPGKLDNVPTIAIPKNLKTMNSLLSSKTSFSDMYEKHKVPMNLTFDQELLEGFLTGLGIAL